MSKQFARAVCWLSLLFGQKWAHQRKVFGKALIEQPVIRQKFAAMFSLVESGQAWLEQITYQMTKMDYKTQSDLLAGPIGGLKMQLTRNLGFIADNCVQSRSKSPTTRTECPTMSDGIHNNLQSLEAELSLKVVWVDKLNCFSVLTNLTHFWVCSRLVSACLWLM